jgi:hypothetical protein
MERIRNWGFDLWELVAKSETCHTPLESLVQAKEELADVYPHTLSGKFQPGEHRDSMT